MSLVQYPFPIQSRERQAGLSHEHGETMAPRTVRLTQGTLAGVRPVPGTGLRPKDTELTTH